MAKKWTIDDIPSQNGKVFLITGANSGVGLGAAKAIARRGGRVIMAVRNLQKGKVALEKIRREVANADLELMQLDLADLESVNRFAEEFKKNYNQLDCLINNAGIALQKREQTKQGFEAHWGTNYLGPFVLTAQLLPLLETTTNSRIVTVASFVPKLNHVVINWDDLQYERNFDAMTAYGQSKLANIMFALELDEKLKEHNSPVLSLLSNPGYTKSGIQKTQGLLIQIMTLFLAQSVDIGMLGSLRAAVDPDVKGGEFFGPVKMKEMRGYPEKMTVPGPALNRQARQKLWPISEQMTHTHFLFSPPKTI